MSRSGYSDDCDQWDLIRWRGAVKSAIRGKKGQAFLRELAAAIEALPERRLIARELEQDGAVCAINCCPFDHCERCIRDAPIIKSLDEFLGTEGPNGLSIHEIRDNATS